MAKFDAVFEGGGAKGVAFAGAMQVLREHGHELRRVIGTSAGAITAALSAAGYTPEEMLAAVMERLAGGKPRFSSFMDMPHPGAFPPQVRENSLTMRVLREVDLPFVPASLEDSIDRVLLDRLVAHPIFGRLFSFIECGGFYCGDVFVSWLKEKLALKGISAGCTLRQFAAQTGSDLSVVVSDSSDMEEMILNHRTAPDVPVAMAVRMSMSIPFVWQEVIWQAGWGEYLGRTKAGNVFVDGGMLSNFPIRMIALRDEVTRPIMGDTDPDGAGNLGLMIDEKLRVPNAPDTRKTPLDLSGVRTIQRVGRLVDTMTSSSDNEMIRRFQSDICRLPAKGYGTLEFDMDGERLEVFLQAARDAMTEHLRARGLARAAAV